MKLYPFFIAALAVLIVTLLSSCAPKEPAAPAAPRNMVEIEPHNDVPMTKASVFPSDWEVIVDSADVFEIAEQRPDRWVYSLGKGDIIQVRTMSADNVWAMIGPAYWVRFEYLRKVDYSAPQEDPAGAVFEGFNLEMSAWYVCVDEARVYSNPGEDANWYLASLTIGTPVTVRELDQSTRTFAMIEVAKYTKFTNLCTAED